MAAGSDQGRQPAHRAASPPSAGGGVGSRSLNPEPDSSQSGEQAMKVETISYEADGLAMESLLYLDADKAGPRPAVLVFHEAFVLGENAKPHAERLAEIGYPAHACDRHAEAQLYVERAAERGVET